MAPSPLEMAATKGEFKEAIMNPDHRDKNGFVLGSVVRISVENFMVYDSVDAFPGPKLNLVLGANGTGKSTIVAALCLGLGGNKKFLARGNDITDFIKRGCNGGWCEIELSGGGIRENLVVRRILRRKKTPHSRFIMDGKNATESTVRKTVREMGIQVDNLVQFLPQERVADFVRLDSVQTLVLTQQAAGRTDLIKAHETLKNSADSRESGERKIAELEITEAKEMKETAQLKKDVDALADLRSRQDQVALLKSKIPWIEYQLKEESAEIAKQSSSEAVSAYKIKTTTLGPVLQRPIEIQAKVKALAKEREKKHIAYQECNDVMRAAKLTLSKSQRKLKSSQDAIDAIIEEDESIKRNVERLKQRVEVDRAAIEAIPKVDMEAVEREKEELSAEMSATRALLTEAKGENRQLKAELSKLGSAIESSQRLLRGVVDPKDRVVRALQSSHSFKSATLVRQAIQRRNVTFKGDVFGPVILEISPHTVEDAKVMESLVPGILRSAFVCENPEDERVLRSLAKTVADGHSFTCVSQMGEWRSKLHARSAPPFQPTGPVTGWALQCADMPDLVKYLLCERSAIPNTALVKSGSDYLSVLKNRGVRAVVENMRILHQGMTSKYTSQTASRTKDILNPKILHQLVRLQGQRSPQEQRDGHLRDIEVSKAAAVRVRSAIQGLSATVTERSLKCSSLSEQMLELNKAGKERRRALQLLKKSVDKLNAEKEKSIDKKRLAKKCKEESLARADLLRSHANLMETAAASADAHIDADEVTVMEQWAKSRLDEEAEACAKAKAELKELEMAAKLAKDKAKQLRAVAKEARRKASQVSPLTPEIQEKFKDLPSDLVVIHAEIAELNSKAGYAVHIAEDVEEKYNGAAASLAEVTRLLEKERNTLRTQLHSTDKIAATWKKGVADMIAELNEHFSASFLELGNAGEVVLNVPINKNDFENYGIGLKARFRQETGVREVNAQQQSGGEKSVCTMLYLLALQNLTRCPFRVVDEINQGMDARNERMVFKRMVNVGSAPQAPQSFTITPKLLHDLHYTEDVTILCVHNGPFFNMGGTLSKTHQGSQLTDAIVDDDDNEDEAVMIEE